MANMRRSEDPVHPTEKEREPYGLHWLDSAYQQTLLPNAPWHQLEDKVLRVVAPPIMYIKYIKNWFPVLQLEDYM